MMRSGSQSQNPRRDSSTTHYRGIAPRIHSFPQKGETMKIARTILCVLCIVAAVAVTAEAGTAFTYQGKLNDGGNPANGAYNLSFTLFSALTGGSQVGPVVAKAVSITNGYFTTELDFGAVFTGSDRWLEIKVGSTILTPRQKVNPTPYAQYAFGGNLTLPFSGTGASNCPVFKVTNTQTGNFQIIGCFRTAGQFETPGAFGVGVVGKGGEAGVVGQCANSTSQGWLGGPDYGVWSQGNLVVEPVSGGGGGDLIMKASDTTPNDPGDIIFRTYDGVQKARIWSKPEAGSNVLNFSGGDNSWDLMVQDRYVGIWGELAIYGASSGNIVLRLGEGLDYAEGFTVSAKSEVGPGTVLIIDAANPGKLALSTEVYDTKVAGIVAGAKGLGSGVRLGTGQFDKDVALAGRVYCNVDATKEAVRPGDLLTTSATPGHAMKVTEHGKAQGAILGKAMENLELGKKGQILVLVTLQ
jgi:hypothetical protein